MRTLVCLTAFACLMGGAHAIDLVKLKLVNNSSKSVVSVSTFAIGRDGIVVDDNVGGMYDPIGPGQTGLGELSLVRCQVVLAIVTLEGGEELRTNLNLCDDDTLTVND